jgi:predicted DNA-binding transcriptional regulator AlpA
VHPSDHDDRRAASLASEKLRHGWLRVGCAAAYLGIGVGTLNKLRTYGGGPRYSKLGHTVVYDSADLDAWATERKVRSTSEPVHAA